MPSDHRRAESGSPGGGRVLALVEQAGEAPSSELGGQREPDDEGALLQGCDLHRRCVGVPVAGEEVCVGEQVIECQQ